MQMLTLMTLVMFAIPALVAAVAVRMYVRTNANRIVLNAYIKAGRLIPPPLLFNPTVKYRLTGFLFFLLKGINRLVMFPKVCRKLVGAVIF